MYLETILVIFANDRIKPGAFCDHITIDFDLVVHGECRATAIAQGCCTVAQEESDGNTHHGLSFATSLIRFSKKSFQELDEVKHMSK